MIRPFAIAALLLLSFSAAAASSPISDAMLRAIAENQAKKYNITISIAVFAPSTGMKTPAVGTAGRISADPTAPAATADDVFVWGSITKISTGTAILALAQAGKLSLNDSIALYVDPMLASMKLKDPSLNFSSVVDLWVRRWAWLWCVRACCGGVVCALGCGSVWMCVSVSVCALCR